MPVATPITNAEALFHIWNKAEIYTGPDGTGVYVPKVGDMIFEIINATKSEYVVTAVDSSTLISSWRVITGSTTDGDLTMNALFAVGPGADDGTFNVYIDKSVTPYRLTIDGRCNVAGSMIQHYKVFAGTDVSETGAVISAIYDNSGNYLGENGAMEAAGSFAGKTLAENIAIKVPMPCRTMANLIDGDTVSVVFYDASGFVVWKQQLVAINTAAVRRLNAESKEVVDITLQTPFLAAVNGRQINFPVNVPLNALNLIGVVHYSDGTTEELAVDGTRFTVMGLDAYVPTIVGQNAPINLKYQLQDGESAYGIDGQNSNHISRTYTITTQAVDGKYAVLLQPYPEWINDTAGYRLRWWLHDLQRSINTDVTSFVVLDTDSIFLPKAYGTKQTLKAVLNLNNVNPTYDEFYHVQLADVLLSQPDTNRPAVGAAPNWAVAPVSGTLPMYGKGAYVKYYAPSANNNTVQLRGDYETYETWLNAYFYASSPLYDPTAETKAPEPTHFSIAAGGVTNIYPISQWNVPLVLTQVLSNNAPAQMAFFKRTPSKDLQMATIGLTLRRINSSGAYL